MAMDIDPFSMLEVSLQEGPEVEDQRLGHNASSGVMHQVENDVQVVQPPPPLHFFGSDVLTPQRAVLSNIQKLSATSKDEEKFRRRAYSSISLVLRKRLHCTICDAHIGAYLGLKDMDIEHPLLKVLACSKCTLKYHYLEFPLSIEGRDVRCRWCTASSKDESPLRYCNYCPFAFCEMCIYRNLPLDELASNKSNWVCFVCNVKDLWPSRAVLWALRVLIDTNLALKEEKKWSTDQSQCCKNKMPKQRQKVVTLPQGGVQPTNGHNVAVRAAVLPNQFRMPQQNNSYRMPYNRATTPVTTPSILRPVVTVPAFRAIRPAVQPVRPVTIPVPAIANSASTQLYDTSWLTEKVSNISTTLLNLNNNLHRLAQGIPEKENKYSIKSKMISMVSLLNISATQLQKASKEMEEESKRILDKNYRVARITPVVSSEAKPAVVPVAKPVMNLKRPPPRNRSTSCKRSRRGKRISQDSDSDPDDPDFRTKAKIDGFSENDSDFECDEASKSPVVTRTYETRACFVKLERINYKYVDGYDSGSDSETGSKFEGPKPSTSFAPDPGTVSEPSELPDRRDADSGSVDAEDCGERLKNEEPIDEKQQRSEVSVDDEAVSKDADDTAIAEETEDSPTPDKENDDCTTSKGVDDSATSKETNDSTASKEEEVVDDSTESKEVDDPATSKEVDEPTPSKQVDDCTASEQVDDSTSSKEADDSGEPAEADDSGEPAEADDSGEPAETDDKEEPRPQSEADSIHADEDTTELNEKDDVTEESRRDVETERKSTTDVEENELTVAKKVDDSAKNADNGISSSDNPSSDSSSLDTSDESSKSDDSTE